MNRRHFLIEAGKAFPIVAGAAYFVGCDSTDNGGGDSNNNNNNNGGPQAITVQSTVDDGHSHSAQLALDDLESGTAQSINTSNSGGHAHMVMLSAAQLETIQNGSPVTVTSTNNAGHTHDFTFRMTPVSDPDPELPDPGY